MKRLVIGLVITSILFASMSNAQEDEQRAPRTTGFGIDFGGMGGPVLKVSQFGDGLLATFGGRGAMTIAKMFMIGGGGYATLAHTDLLLDGKKETVNLGYGVAGLGIKLFTNSLFHLSNFNNFGFGTISLAGRNEKSFCYVIEPELNAELNILYFMRVGLGASYRLMFAKDLSVASSQLGGFGGQFYLEFGWL